MLIKDRDRLTIDAILALDASLADGGTVGFEELLKKTRENPRSADNLPFADQTQKAFRFFLHRGDATDAVSLEDAKTALKGDARLLLFAPVSEVRQDPHHLEEFLAGEAHTHLPFNNTPIIVGYGNGLSISVQEGSNGRKYARSLDEIVKFMRSHPAASSLYSDIEMRTGFQQKIESADDLAKFMAVDPEEGVDWVLDVLAMTTGYMFGEEFPNEIKSQQAFIMEMNLKAKATMDFHLFETANKKPYKPAYAQAEADLRKALSAIIAYAEKMNIKTDARSFAEAVSMLGAQPASQPPRLWTIAGRSAEHYRLFQAAVSADCFAGMASWNDVQIKQDEAFHRISNQVVLNLLESVCVSASI